MSRRRECPVCSQEAPEGRGVWGPFGWRVCYPKCWELVSEQLKDRSQSPRGRFRSKREVLAALGKPLQSRGPRPPAASFLEAFGEALAKLVPAVVLLLQRGANWLPRPLVVWRDTHSEPHRASVQKYGPGLVRLAVDCEGAWGIPQRVWRELDVPPDSLRSALPSLELTLTDGELTAELAAWLAGAITHGVTQAPPLEMEPNFFDPETRQLYSYFWTAAASAEHQRRR